MTNQNQCSVQDLIENQMGVKAAFTDPRDRSEVPFGDGVPLSSVVGVECVRLYSIMRQFQGTLREHATAADMAAFDRHVLPLVRDVMAVVCNG